MDEAITKVIRKSPFYFLYNLSGKIWARPYIDEAVKEATKLDPEYFLEHWATTFPQGINLALFVLGNKNVSR